MGDPKKKRKKYATPRKKWDKQLLVSERKLVDFYGLKNKKELRKHETWLKNKRTIARSLLALPLDKRQQRQGELMSGLQKIGLVQKEATLDDVLSLKVEAVLEKRLQTLTLRKGLANTSNQARQFIVHGHIAIKKEKINAPSYLVPVNEALEIGWFRKPLELNTAPAKKADLKKEFEESAGKTEEETKEKEKKEDSTKKEVKEEKIKEIKKEKASGNKQVLPKADAHPTDATVEVKA